MTKFSIDANFVKIRLVILEIKHIEGQVHILLPPPTPLILINFEQRRHRYLTDNKFDFNFVTSERRILGSDSWLRKHED